MNKLRRRENQISFPKVDKETPGHLKGNLPGNMMAYPEKAGPQTSHIAGKMRGNMMAYPAGRQPLAQGEGYGNKPLSEPTRSGFDGKKTMPAQMKEYVGYNPDKPEWTQIASTLKKKGAFYGK